MARLIICAKIGEKIKRQALSNILNGRFGVKFRSSRKYIINKGVFEIKIGICFLKQIIFSKKLIIKLA